MKRQNVENVINQALDVLDCKIKSLDGNTKLSHFKRAHIVSADEEILSNDFEIWNDGKIRDVENKLDFTILRLSKEKNYLNGDEYPICAHRLRTVDLKSTRGKIIRPYANILELSVLGVLPSINKGFAMTDYFGVDDRGTHFITNTSGNGSPDKRFLEENANTKLSIAIGWQFRNYYYWNASIGLPNGISITFETNATGAMSLFKDREKLLNRTKRSPIINWVNEHWRQKRSEPEVEQRIRKHFRGTTTFKWNDYVVEIRPSKDAIKEYKKERLLSQLEKLKKENLRLKGAAI